jgi:hypothetical protein
VFVIRTRIRIMWDTFQCNRFPICTKWSAKVSNDSGNCQICYTNLKTEMIKTSSVWGLFTTMVVFTDLKFDRIWIISCFRNSISNMSQREPKMGFNIYISHWMCYNPVT